MTARRHTIFTVGHSTHLFPAFVEMLAAHGIETIADVRRYPKSRRNPQFNDDALALSLPREGIAYVSFIDLGGRRRPLKDSPNAAWRSESFRGYADFMMTDPFTKALGRLETLAAKSPTAIMCAEAVPWRCHRSLIADALTVRGWKVMDITSRTAASEHALPEFAVVHGKVLRYPEVKEPGLFDAPD